MGLRVSILTPSFNQARWLADNLLSVEHQTYPHVEQIVMDGGSTDDSVEILTRARPSVRWRSEADRGQSDALNKAFAASSGEIIGWLNSDDAYADRRAVAEAVRIFQEHPEVGVVYGHSLLVNPANRVLQIMWAPEFSRSLLRLYTYWTQPAAFFRRSLIEDRLVDEELHYVMDRDLWWRLADKTQFRRMDLVAAIDRHQPARKTLNAGYLTERDAFLRANGINPETPWRRIMMQGAKTVYRYRGALTAMHITELIDPAIDLRYDGTNELLRRQVLQRRHAMPLD